MGKYRKKPVVVEAITFNELIAYGKVHSVNIVDGMPWSFSYKGHPITHEDDECYLIPTLEGPLRMTPVDMLITGARGEIYPWRRDIFEAAYEKEGEEKASQGETTAYFLDAATLAAGISALEKYRSEHDESRKERAGEFSNMDKVESELVFHRDPRDPRYMQTRTVVILIETDCPDSEILCPHLVKALREYAEELESGVDNVGSSDMERWKTSDGKSTLKFIHGNNFLY